MFIPEGRFVRLSKPHICVLLLLLLSCYATTLAQQSGLPLLAYDDLVALYRPNRFALRRSLDAP